MTRKILIFIFLVQVIFTNISSVFATKESFDPDTRISAGYILMDDLDRINSGTTIDEESIDRQRLALALQKRDARRKHPVRRVLRGAKNSIARLLSFQIMELISQCYYVSKNLINRDMPNEALGSLWGFSSPGNAVILTEEELEKKLKTMGVNRTAVRCTQAGNVTASAISELLDLPIFSGEILQVTALTAASGITGSISLATIFKAFFFKIKPKDTLSSEDIDIVDGLGAVVNSPNMNADGILGKLKLKMKEKYHKIKDLIEIYRALRKILTQIFYVSDESLKSNFGKTRVELVQLIEKAHKESKNRFVKVMCFSALSEIVKMMTETTQRTEEIVRTNRVKAAFTKIKNRLTRSTPSEREEIKDKIERIPASFLDTRVEAYSALLSIYDDTTSKALKFEEMILLTDLGHKFRGDGNLKGIGREIISYTQNASIFAYKHWSGFLMLASLIL